MNTLGTPTSEIHHRASNSVSTSNDVKNIVQQNHGYHQYQVHHSSHGATIDPHLGHSQAQTNASYMASQPHQPKANGPTSSSSNTSNNSSDEPGPFTLLMQPHHALAHSHGHSPSPPHLNSALSPSPSSASPQSQHHVLQQQHSQDQQQQHIFQHQHQSMQEHYHEQYPLHSPPIPLPSVHPQHKKLHRKQASDSYINNTCSINTRLIRSHAHSRSHSHLQLSPYLQQNHPQNLYQQPNGFAPFPSQKRMQHDGPNHPKFLRTMSMPMKPPAPSATRHHYQHGCDDTNMDSDASSDAESGNEGVHWTRQEDNLLREAVIKFNGKAWKRIAEYCFPDGSRDKDQCLQRWRMISKPRSIKGPWTPEEDRQLRTLVNELGAEKWVLIASRLGSRTGKQCRERWHNHLDPRIDKSPFTAQEDELIFKLFAQFGSKWAEMSKLMPGRPDNAIKNHFNTSMQRKRRRLSLQDPSELQNKLNGDTDGAISPPLASPTNATSPSIARHSRFDPYERRHSMPSLALTPKSQQGPNVHINHKRSGSRDYLTENNQHYQHHANSAGSGGYPCSNPTLIKAPDSRMPQPLSLGMSRSVSLGSSERHSAVPRSILGPQLHQPPLQNGQMRPNLPGIGSLHSGQYPHIASTMAAMASSSSTAVTSVALSTSPPSKLSRSISASMVTTSMNGRSCPDHPGDSYHTVQRHNMTGHETMGARPSWLARGHGHEHHRSLDADPFSALSELANVAEQYRELPCGSRVANTITTVVVQSKDETDEDHFQRRGSNGNEPMTRSRSGSSGSITMEEAVTMTKIERPLPPPPTGPIGRRFSTLGHVKEEEHGEDGENNQHQYHSNLIDPRNNAASPLGHNRSYSDWSHGGSRDLGSANYRSKRLSVDFSPPSEMTMEDDDDCMDEDRLMTKHDRSLDDRHNRKGPHSASPPCSSSGHSPPYLAKRRPSVRDLMAINHLCLSSEEVERS